METFIKETERLIEILKETEERLIYQDEAFICKYCMNIIGFDCPPFFWLEYRGCVFLLIEGTAWEVPQIKEQLPNYKERIYFILLSLFILFLDAYNQLDKFETEIIKAYEGRKLCRLVFNYLKNIKEKEKLDSTDFILFEETRQRIGTIRALISLLHNISGKYAIRFKDFSKARKFFKVIGVEEKIDDCYKNVLPILEEKFLNLLEWYKSAYNRLNVVNPDYSFHNYLWLFWEAYNGELYGITPKDCINKSKKLYFWGNEETKKEFLEPAIVVKEEKIDRIIFLPEDWRTGEDLTRIQLELGMSLVQKGLLNKQEENELTKLASTVIKTPLENLSWEAIKNYKGSATPKGLFAYFGKRKKNRKDMEKSCYLDDSCESFEYEDQSIEDFEDYDSTNERNNKPIAGKNKKIKIREELPLNEYASIYEVAELLNKKFPNRMKSTKVWMDWLYREIKRGNIKAEKKEKRITLSENVSYVTLRYFIKKEKLLEVLELFKKEEIQKNSKKQRAELVKLYAKEFNTTVQNARKMIRKHGLEEIARRILEKRRRDEYLEEEF